MISFRVFFLSLLLLTCSLRAQVESLAFENLTAENFNSQLFSLKEQIRSKYEVAMHLSDEEKTEEKYKNLLEQIRLLKCEANNLSEKWRKSFLSDNELSDDPSGFWDPGEITISNLIMEYGGLDYLYVIPQELSTMKISLYSHISIPKQSWSEMLEVMLAHNGIGVKKINPFTKQLYILKLDPCAIEAVISNVQDLDLFSPQSRLFYVLSAPSEQLKSLQAFFERFSDPKQTTVQAVASKIVLISSKESIEKLLGLYKAVWEKEQGKVVKVLKSLKILPAEAEKVLKAFFSDANKNRPTFNQISADELTILTLPQGLVLVGENETVSRGEKIIQDLEEQLEDPGEKVIYWYSCKHSNPEDVAAVLEKVYDSLVGCSFEKKAESQTGAPSIAPPVAQPPLTPSPNLSSDPNPVPMYPGQNTIFNPVLPANPPFIQPGTIDKNTKTAFGNFIVDTKTTSILMVVRREELPKIKALLKKMDVPKRMVQLDVLLVEKKLTDRRQIGFDLLQFGTNSSGKNENAVVFDAKETAINKGIFSYLFSRESGSWPAMDIRFNFLLSQEDVKINSNPSVLTTNQSPVTISVVDEISINNGAFPIQTQSGVLVEQSYTRAQYGTTLVLTPTIHLSQNSDEGDSPGFVSLQTNIEFDTTKISFNDRPPVTRRHIENEVCIPDGETVILGGLRSKIENDQRDKIPFLGDLPGLGKLFGSTKQADLSTEMFIFITPRIIKDPEDNLRKIRQSEYKLRAGDIPEFLQALDEAKEQERKRQFSNSIKVLFDMY